MGPAITLLAGYLTAILISGIALRASLTRPLRATWPLRERGALLVAYGAGFAAARATEHTVPSTAGLLLCLAAGASAYVLAFRVFGGINLRDRGRASEAIRWFRSKREQRALPNLAQVEVGGQGNG
jgi:hypothetical protein